MASVTVARPSLDDVYLRYAGRRFADADSGTGTGTGGGTGGPGGTDVERAAPAAGKSGAR